MSHQAKWEYVRALHTRYRQASRPLTQRILDEFCQVSGSHRQDAIRLLNGPPPGRPRSHRRHRGPRDSPQILRILAAIWAAAGYPWSVRLKARLPLWLPWARARLRLTPLLEQPLLTLSPRQMDRRLPPHTRQVTKRPDGRTKPGTRLTHHIPLRTEHWVVSTPGFTEVDVVSHSGEGAEGASLHSLTLTDIHPTWVATRAVMGKGQAGVQAALEARRAALPFALKGIDADHGAECPNAHLDRSCQARAIQFTRGRPDQAGRQRPWGAEALDPRPQAHGLRPRRLPAGAGGHERAGPATRAGSSSTASCRRSRSSGTRAGVSRCRSRAGRPAYRAPRPPRSLRPLPGHRPGARASLQPGASPSPSAADHTATPAQWGRAGLAAGARPGLRHPGLRRHSVARWPEAKVTA